MDTDRHTGHKNHDAARENEQTGLPGLRRWRGVYWVVFGCFLLWVFLLALLTKVFA